MKLLPLVLVISPLALVATQAICHETRLHLTEFLPETNPGRLEVTASSAERDVRDGAKILHLRGDVEVRMITCGRDHKGVVVCDRGSMVLHADAVDFNENTGEIQPSGNVRVAPYPNRPSNNSQDADFNSAKTGNRPEFLEIITPHEGVDFTGFSADVARVIQRNWWARMPSETKQKLDRELKGKVIVGFGIQKDGHLSVAPKIEVGSGNKALDEAAVSAVKASAPFEHLPEAFKGPNIDIRLTFVYNQPLSPPNP